jgi:serine/threonine-protein kinase
MRPPGEPRLPVSIGEIVAGKYVVERVVGSGGMGIIASARHIQLEQRVALKFLHTHVLSNDQAVARFMREARSTVRLKSDHVARVFDVDTLPTGEPYAVMELLEGVDLATYRRENGKLRIADAVEFVVQACEGIVEAHALGIVHRDLKPQNLFVTRRINGSPRIKVLDFGISKSIGGADMSLTDSTVVLGSPLYMAPEQMKASRSADTRSDVWSLGVILYELLTGEVPFDGETITELCLKVVTAPPREPREIRAELPEPLAKAVLCCLAKDPADRFPSVAALAEALEPYSAGAERGVADRTWRSLAETADALRVVQTQVETPPAASTHSTWDKVAEPAPLSRRRGFYRGVAAGAALTAVCVAAAATLMLFPRALSQNAEPVPVSATSVTHASAVEVPAQAPSEPQASAPTTGAAPTATEAPKAPIVRHTSESSHRGGARKAPPSEPAVVQAPHAATAADAGAAPSFQTTANGSPILP